MANWAVAGGCAFLLLAVVAVFGQTIGFDFVNFDDNLYVYDNPNLAKGLSVEGVAWAFSATEANNWHPLTWLSLLLDYSLFGRNAWGYHLMNVLLHAANAILLFLVLRRMTGEFWPSLLAATVFAVHPLRVESVAWVSERKDVLAGLFFMLTLWAYAGYARRPFSDRGLSQFSRRDSRPVEKTLDRRENGTVPLAPRVGDRSMFSAKGFFAKCIFRPKNGPVPTIHWLRYSAVAVLFALGLMAKPMLVTLPFVLLLLDFWPLGRFSGSLSLRRLLLEKLPLFMLSAVSCVVTSWAQGEAVERLDLLPLSTRVGNALLSYAVYLRQFVHPSGLAAFYPYPDDGLPLWQIAGVFVFLAVVSVAACMAVWKRVGLFFPVGWFWFLGMLVPVIGLVQVGQQARADRYAYLPQIGLAIVLAWGLDRMTASRPDRARIFCALVVFAAAAFGIGARRQASYWLNSETLWRRTLDCTERNAEAHYNLGLALADQDRLDEAVEQFNRAIAIRPNYVLAHNNLGVTLNRQGRTIEAVRHYRAALDANPHFALSRVNLGIALEKLQKYDEAMQEYRKALDDEPRNAEARYNSANLLLMRGRSAEAVEEYRRAIDAKPDYAEARYNLGVVLYHQGRYSEAVEQWEAIVRNDPQNVLGLNRLALALSACPDDALRNGPRAVELAGRAVRLTDGLNPGALDALAAAQAETGRFAEAAATAQRALALAEQQGNAPLVAALHGRLRFYQSNSPFRDIPQSFAPHK